MTHHMRTITFVLISSIALAHMQAYSVSTDQSLKTESITNLVKGCRAFSSVLLAACLAIEQYQAYTTLKGNPKKQTLEIIKQMFIGLAELTALTKLYRYG